MKSLKAHLLANDTAVFALGKGEPSVEVKPRVRQKTLNRLRLHAKDQCKGDWIHLIHEEARIILLSNELAVNGIQDANILVIRAAPLWIIQDDARETARSRG